MSRPSGEAGFTLVELLVVLVIMPMVIGAIAAAIIIGEQDSGVAGDRLSDTSSAQINSEYYVRDVQGAQYVTTDSSATGFGEVCTDPSGNATLALALYRSSTPTSNALSVAYWVRTSTSSGELVRDSCAGGGSTPTSQVVISDDVSPSQVAVTITPPDEGTTAQTGWVQTESIDQITISVTESGSGYTYTLQASPRLSGGGVSGSSGQGAPSGAALVSLSDVTLSGNASISVDGAADINGSLIGAGLTATGGINTSIQVTDPLAEFLPSSITAGNPYTGSCKINKTVTLDQGVYNCKLSIENGADVTLQPGVYQLNQGIAVSTGASVSVGSGGGALLYIPNGAATFEAGARIDIPPLSAAQSLLASNGTTTALQDVWFWQTASDSNIAFLVGNGTPGNASGFIYAPDAQVDLTNSSAGDATGGIIGGGISMTPPSGSASLTVTGQ